MQNNTIQNYNEKMKAKAEWVDAQKLVQELHSEIFHMFQWKKDAVKKIALEAEKLASNHSYDKNIKFPYINAKRICDAKYGTECKSGNGTSMELFPHPNFDGIKVNPSHSAIHVPVNVYDEGYDLLNHVKWSEALDTIFKNNKEFDPNLSWQYFASSSGFLRLYPAAKWRIPQYVINPISLSSKTEHAMTGKDSDGLLDLYDARMKSWYIQSAASPKDMIILLDGSGSMTGQRKEIAKNVVLMILETLTDDDYVNIIRFGSALEPVVECFGLNTLVQANKPNLREFKDRMEGMNTSDIANFTLALNHAFDTFNLYASNREGTMCNQAIMLVTDGAPDTFEPIFKNYNWPRIPVRVFTYLVGREVTETKEVNWMACHNKGYYTHVANMAEVREQVQLYIPVMSRPLVLSGDEKRPYQWSPVYSDVTV